jgi:hypothetical protein
LELPTGRYYADRKGLFKMWAGSFSPTYGYVWADNFEDAFEEWVEYLDVVCPGCFVTVGEDELKEAADDLGLEWKSSWPDWSDPEFERVVENAEADLTAIGHTTLNSGTHIASHEWGGDDISGDEESAVWRVCAVEYEAQYDEYPEPPDRIQAKRGVKFKLDGLPTTRPSRKLLPRWARLQRRT